MPRVVDAGQRRTEITDAAARVIARSGIEATTMREVAAEGGWTTGVVTHYFADKRELLLTTFRQSLARRRSLRPPGESTDPSMQLRASLEGCLPLDDDRRRHWLVTIACCAQAAGDDVFAVAQRDAYREFLRHVTALITAGALGSPAADDPTTVAEQVIAIADGIAIQALFDPEHWTPDRQLGRLEQLLATRN